MTYSAERKVLCNTASCELSAGCMFPTMNFLLGFSQAGGIILKPKITLIAVRSPDIYCLRTLVT